MSVTFGGYVKTIYRFCNRSCHSRAQAGNVFAFAPDISQSKSASEDIIRLIDAKPEIDSESSDGNTLENVTGKIELRDVHFRYPTRPTVRVLRGFNLTVEPGTHVALVGASGCGKSTVIQVSLAKHQGTVLIPGNLALRTILQPTIGQYSCESPWISPFLILKRWQIDGQSADEFPVAEYRKHIALVQQEPVSALCCHHLSPA